MSYDRSGDDAEDIEVFKRRDGPSGFENDSEEPEERGEESQKEPEEEEEEDDESSNQGSVPKKRKGSPKEDAQSVKKVTIEYIKKKDKRQVTFSKRKAGIMKKAYELATLTGTQVLILVVSENGVVFTYTTNKFQPLVAPQADGQPSAGQRLIHNCIAEDGELVGDLAPPAEQPRPAAPAPVVSRSGRVISAPGTSSRTSKLAASSIRPDLDVVAEASSSPTVRTNDLSGHQRIPSSPLRPLPPLQHPGQALDYSAGPSVMSGGMSGMAPVQGGSYYDGRGGMMEGQYSQQNSIYGINPNPYDPRNATIYPPDLRYTNNDPTQRPFPTHPHPQFPYPPALYPPAARTPDPQYIDPNLRQHQRSSSSTSATASSSHYPPSQHPSAPRPYPPITQQPQQQHQQPQEIYPQQQQNQSEQTR